MKELVFLRVICVFYNTKQMSGMALKCRMFDFKFDGKSCRKSQDIRGNRLSNLNPMNKH